MFNRVILNKNLKDKTFSNRSFSIRPNKVIQAIKTNDLSTKKILPKTNNIDLHKGKNNNIFQISTDTLGESGLINIENKIVKLDLNSLNTSVLIDTKKIESNPIISLFKFF